MRIFKKILLVLLAAIVVLAGVFFILGWLNPTVSYQTAVEVNKPREQAWKLFTDSSKTGEWLEGFKSFETISGEHLKPGSVFRMTIVMDGQEFVMTETMKDVKEPELFAFKLENDVLTNDAKITLTESNGKTRIVSDEAVTGKNLFWKSLFFWCESIFKTGSQNNLDRLKAYMERQP